MAIIRVSNGYHQGFKWLSVLPSLITQEPDIIFRITEGKIPA